MARLRQAVPKKCVTHSYGKDGCSVSMAGAPPHHVTVNLDCSALRLNSTEKRCDLLFVGEDGKDAWVAPIELKSGRFRVDEVKDQLQKGADLADKWLPTNAAFRFVPVVACGRGISKHKIRALHQAAVTLRGKKRRPVLIRCRSPLREALDVSPSGAAKVQRP